MLASRDRLIRGRTSHARDTTRRSVEQPGLAVEDSAAGSMVTLCRWFEAWRRDVDEGVPALGDTCLPRPVTRRVGPSASRLIVLIVKKKSLRSCRRGNAFSPTLRRRARLGAALIWARVSRAARRIPHLPARPDRAELPRRWPKDWYPCSGTRRRRVLARPGSSTPSTRSSWTDEPNYRPAQTDGTHPG